MIELRKHVLSKYLTTNILYVFYLLIETNDLKRVIFDIWSLLWCKEEHIISNMAFDALDYVIMNKKYSIYTCLLCQSIHYYLEDYDLSLFFEGIRFPTLGQRDCWSYAEWVTSVYHTILKRVQNQIIQKPKTSCSLYCTRISMPRDNLFESCLLPFYNIEHLYSVVERKEKELEDRLFKRRK